MLGRNVLLTMPERVASITSRECAQVSSPAQLTNGRTSCGSTSCRRAGSARCRRRWPTRSVLQETPAPLGRSGTHKVPVAPFLMSDGNPSIERPAPAIGEHTNEVLEAAGFTPEQIEALIASGAASRHTAG